MEKKVLDHGFVRLVDYMPQKELDSAIVQAARVSYGEGTKTSRGDAGLIRYLMRHWHKRHRMASVNEYSARYSIVPEQYYKPEVLRGQSKVNHQGSEGEIDKNDERENVLNKHFDTSYEIYKYLLDDGLHNQHIQNFTGK